MSRIIYPKLTQIPRIICIVLMFGIFNVAQAQQLALEPIAIGENKVATVSAGVSHDFVFSAAAGQTITIQALAITPGLAPAFAVLEIDATLVENFDNPLLQSTVTGVVSLSEAGDYIISVATRNGVEGDVLVTVAEGGTPPIPPTPLQEGQRIEDVLDPGGTITYSFLGSLNTNFGLRLLYNSLDLTHGLSAQLHTTDGRILATASNELLELTTLIPPNPQGSYLLTLTNDHPAAVTVRYALVLNPVDFAAPTPTVMPATLIPLPSTGPCVLATQGQFVNMRQGPSTSSPIITTIFPTVIYNVIGRTQDASWYQISAPEGSGWVSAAVTRLGGDCSAVPVVSASPTATFVPVVTSTATATAEATETVEATEEPEVTDEPTVEITPTAEATEEATPQQ
jgi:uncharacterized protein YraI